MEQKGEVDALWYDVTENELRAYLGVNIIMGINELNYQATRTKITDQSARHIFNEIR